MHFMNGDLSSVNPGVPDLRDQQRLVRCVLVLLSGACFIGVASVISGVTSGTITSHHHHTFTSRVFLSAVTAFGLVLIVGLIRRSRFAWRAGFTVPLVGSGVAIGFTYPEVFTAQGEPIFLLMSALLAGLGIWQSLVWRKDWSACEALFQ